MRRSGSTAAMIYSVAAEPGIWLEAVRTGFSLAKRRPVPVPFPDPAYLAWRLNTVYAEAPVVGSDVVVFLKWRKLQRRLAI